MAVTTAQLGQALAMRGFQAGKLAGNRQGKRIHAVRCDELPHCSFNGYYNFIRAHHVQSTAHGSFDCARVSSQPLDL